MPETLQKEKEKKSRLGERSIVRDEFSEITRDQIMHTMHLFRIYTGEIYSSTPNPYLTVTELVMGLSI